MKTPFFTPKDFTLQDDGAVDLRAVRHAAYANEKFDKMIADSPVVYKYSDSPNWMMNQKEPLTQEDERFFSFDQKARLIMIEEIKPKCEKHEPYQRDSQISAPHSNWFCFKCNIPLQATWSAK